MVVGRTRLSFCQYPGDPSSRLHTVDDGISPTIRPQEGAIAPAGG